jgi:trans-2,3-dihydro-3-hydroxyanthranilate isomerase
MTILAHVDVFADGLLSGNPLAVFVDPPEAPGERYQAWAREMNLSETAFAWPTADGTRYRARIFTPRQELPFAGHPTLGTAVVLHRLGRVGRDLVQETAAGETRVTIEADRAWLTPPTGLVGPMVPAKDAAEALGVPSLYLSPDRPPQVVSAGLPYLLVSFEQDHLAQLKPPLARMAAILHRHGVGALMAWAFMDSTQIHARVFAPSHGIDEDPATGSAAAALGVYLRQAAGMTQAVTYAVRQGVEVGRPSTLELRLNDRQAPVRVGGRVVPVFQTTIEAF